MAGESPRRRTARKAAFWLGVATVAIGASFGAELVVDVLAERTKCPPGLARLIAYSHKGVA